MPHSEMQWASSMHRRAGRARSNKGAVAADSSVSGVGEDDQAAALFEPLKRRPALGGAEPAVKRDDRNATLF